MKSMNRRMAALSVFVVMGLLLSLNLGALGANDASPAMKGESERIEEFKDLLDDVESGALSREEALDKLDGLQDKYQIREENRERLTKALEGFDSGELSQDAALLQVRDTLQLRDRIQDEDCDEKIQDMTQDKDQYQDKTQDQDKTGSFSSSGEGKGK